MKIKRFLLLAVAIMSLSVLTGQAKIEIHVENTTCDDYRVYGNIWDTGSNAQGFTFDVLAGQTKMIAFAKPYIWEREDVRFMHTSGTGLMNSLYLNAPGPIDVFSPCTAITHLVEVIPNGVILTPSTKKQFLYKIQ